VPKKAKKKNGKGIKKRTQGQREKDMEYIASEYLRGKYQYEIARELKLTQQQISYDLKEIQRRWMASLDDFDKAKGKELAKLDKLEAELWEAWGRSQNKKIKDTDIIVDDSGDPRFLSGILKCIERRCAILGLDAPKTIAPVGGDTVVVERIERVVLTAGQPYIEGEADEALP